MSVVARARAARVAVFSRPGARHARIHVQRRRVGGRPLPLVFLVLDHSRPGWVRVQLPTRPNHANGWVRASAVTLAQDPYELRVALRRHRLTLRRRGRIVLRTPIAVGRAVSPTPTGRYFLSDLLRPPDPGGFYGPFAFGTSAHSRVLTSFAGGDGQIGLHGTNDPAALGHDVSHGCIRVANAVITRLARRLPLGTPIVIAR